MIDYEQYREITEEEIVLPESDAYGTAYLYLACPCGEHIERREGGTIDLTCKCGRQYHAEISLRVWMAG